MEHYAPTAEPEAAALAAASRRYIVLRRWYWLSFLGAVAGGLDIGLHELLPRLGELLHVPLLGAFLLCCVGNGVLWFSLMRFRCPRCGERFILSTFSSWPGTECKHCRLRLG